MPVRSYAWFPGYIKRRGQGRWYPGYTANMYPLGKGMLAYTLLFPLGVMAWGQLVQVTLEMGRCNPR